MPTKPVSLPVWNTDATNRTTPSGGKQAAGFSLNEAPSSSFQNWWQNLVYQWVNYLNAPIGVATTPALTATAGTGAGSVALRLEAGDASSIPLYCLAQGAAAGLAPLVAGFPGTSAIFATGQTGLPGALFCNVAVGPGAWATTANPGSTGFYGTGVTGAAGGMLVGNGVNVATLLADAGAGTGLGAGSSGNFVAGFFKQYGTTRGTINLAQQSTPSAPITGDFWFNPSGLLEYNDGTRNSIVRRTNYYLQNTARSTSLASFTAMTTFSNGTFTVPLASLYSGARIRIEATFNLSANGSGVTFQQNWTIGGTVTPVGVISSTAAINQMHARVVIEIRLRAAPSASTAVEYSIETFGGEACNWSALGAYAGYPSSVNLTSGFAFILRSSCSLSSASNNIALSALEVSVR